MTTPIKKLMLAMAAALALCLGARAATPRRGSLLYKTRISHFVIAIFLLLAGLAEATTVEEYVITPENNLKLSHTLFATENGIQNQHDVSISVPKGRQAKVYLDRTVDRVCCTGGELTVKTNNIAAVWYAWSARPAVFTSDVVISMRVTSPSPLSYTVMHKVYDYYIHETKYYETYYFGCDYTLAVVYEDILPDLSCDIGLKPSAMIASDESVTLDVTISNGGALEAASSMAIVYVDGRKTSTIHVGVIAPGLSVSKSVSIKDLCAGRHTIGVMVDADNAVGETNEGNNMSTASIFVYERVPYTVRFVPNGGTGNMENQLFVAGTEQRLHANTFSRTDYDFGGWATNATGNVVYEDCSAHRNLSFVKDDVVVLYAVWLPQRHKVTFYGNGGLVYVEGSTSGGDGVVFEYDCTVPWDASKSTARLDGYDFDGWYTSPTGGVELTGNSMIKSDVAVYAHYVEPTYVLKFESGGGEGEMEDFVYKTPARLPANVFTKDGFSFAGWAYDSSPSLMYANDEQVITNGISMTLRATWKRLTSYKFKGGGGDGSMDDIFVESGLNPDIVCEFTREGFVFAGWNRVETGSFTMQCTALWGLELPLSEDCGEIVFAGSFESLSSKGSLWYVDAEGCLTIGPYSHPLSSGGAVDYEGRLFGVVEHDGVLVYDKCTWEWEYVSIRRWLTYAVEEHDLVVKLKGRHHAYSYSTSDVYWGDTVIAGYAARNESFVKIYPKYFIRTAYEFTGEAQSASIAVSAETEWSAESSADWIRIEKDPYNPHKAIVTLEPNDSMWSRTAAVSTTDAYSIEITQLPGIASTCVEFDAMDGTFPTNEMRYAAGKAFGSLPSPSPRHGYVFAGWSAQRSGGDLMDENSIVPEREKLYLYAKWIEKDVAVSFDANGGVCDDAVQSRKFGEHMGATPVPKRAGFVFDGWTTEKDGGAVITGESKICGDVTFYAHWLFSGTGAMPSNVGDDGATDLELRSVDGGVAIKGFKNAMSVLAIPSKLNGKEVVEIADYAFFGNTVITSVTIPASVKKVGVKAFKGCENLKRVVFEGELDTLGQAAFQNCQSLTEVVVPKLGDNYVWSSTFEGCTGLEKVTLPEGVTSIGTSAFANCKSLTDVNIPETVKTIKSFAFFSCESLADVWLPDALKTIGEKAFKNCLALEEIDLPDVTMLGKAAFFNSGLVEVVVLGTVAKVDDYCFQKCANLKKVVLEDGVLETGASCWANDEALEEVVFSSTLKKLGGFAFFRCPSLDTLDGFSGLTSLNSIGEKAFKHCSSLTTLAMPSQVTTIPKEMCNYCSNLQTVTGTANVKSYGANAFSNCPALTSVAGLNASELATVKKGRVLAK